MIFDGPSMFPKSCVHWTKFHSHELQQMFSALREQEEIFQRELERIRDKNDRWKVARGRLEEVQRWLIWMSHNVTGSKAEVERRRRGYGADRDFIREEAIENMDPKDALKLVFSQRFTKKMEG